MGMTTEKVSTPLPLRSCEPKRIIMKQLLTFIGLLTFTLLPEPSKCIGHCQIRGTANDITDQVVNSSQIIRNEDLKIQYSAMEMTFMKLRGQ